jgi:hypothetical protein
MKEALLVMYEGAKISSAYGTYAHVESGRIAGNARISGYLFAADGVTAREDGARGASVSHRLPEPAVRAG